MLLAAVTLAAAAQPARTFDQERHLLSRRLETLRRILPDGREPRRDVAELQRTADEAGLIGLTATPRGPSDDEPRHVVIDLEGDASYGDIDRFFGRLAVSHRLIDVAELTLSATPAELVHYTAVVRIPFHPRGTPLPAPPEGTGAALKGVPASLAEAFLRDEALALLKSDSIARLRRARRNPRLFLAETAAIVRDRPVLLSYASLGEEEFLVRGLTVGEAPARALEARFERGYFRVEEFLMAVSGACHRFEVRGHAPVAGPDAELPLPAVEPFRLEPNPCHVDRDPGGSRSVKAGSSRGSGSLTLRLRDADTADVFRVLHDLTGQGFVVDGDVRGRLDVELVKVTLEEALTALRGAELQIAPAGLVRRVSRAGAAAPPATADDPAGSPGEPRVSFLLKRSDVKELLGVMSELDPELVALGPQASLGQVSVWVRELPLGIVRSAVLDAAGLVEQEVDGQRTLLRASGSAEALVPMLADTPPRVLELGPDEVSATEFEVTGVAGAAGSWRAYAYAATGTLHAWAPGSALADARVAAVAISDVQLESGAGTLRLFVPALR